MLEVRDDEPRYALLKESDSKRVNRYGQPIELTSKDDPLRQQSLQINDEQLPDSNPHRYKQHGFYFTADNCIACHACEAACSEKNDNPGHIAFRSVGFIEGGTYPDYQRQNISMACNHCDDPVCLKGCPTRAYTKFAEYGAVLQDPDICFGCGYCTWVCPYNAPQLDPVEGTVSKCNMCIDRLEAGLKPACVSACLGNALEFGVIENTPENRTQLDDEISGFPDATITRPNIRFQQTQSLNRVMKRVDSAPIKYHREDASGKYRSRLDEKYGKAKYWGIKTLLSSHENAHVIFTLSTQAVMGAFILLVLVGNLFQEPSIKYFIDSSAFMPLLVSMMALMTFGLYKLNMHLGKPHRFYRGFNNLKHSPLSREIAGVSVFFAGLIGYAFFSLFENYFFHILAGLFTLLGLMGFAAGSYYMYKLYRIKARPFWDHWQTATSFYGTMLSLGSLFMGLFAYILMPENSEFLQTMSLFIALGLGIEFIGLLAHAFYLRNGSGEAQAAQYEQTTTFGKTYRLRNTLLVCNMGAALLIGTMDLPDLWSMAVMIVLLISVLISAYLGRILFYALVVPTTMPGAFFWKNKGFVEHARETGLADMQQLGVAYEGHHPFDIQALMKTVREHRAADMLAEAKSILKSIYT